MYDKKDHFELSDAETTRRYFRKFEQITGFLDFVVDEEVKLKRVHAHESNILKSYIQAIGNSFSALSYKYLMTGRVSAAMQSRLEIDRSNSGFPTYTEMLKMANDALQAERYLESLPSQNTLMEDMIREILSEHKEPLNLQYAMAQRKYFEFVNNRHLFWTQNYPSVMWAGAKSGERQRFLIYWAVYDGQTNLPVIYLLDAEDSASEPLVRDKDRWPRLKSHLLAQSVSGLKLLTIAQGLDRDFAQLHPNSLRRITLGPMHSKHFTKQSDVVASILNDANAPLGEDWMLGWSIETLNSKDSQMERKGIFSRQEIQIYDVDSANAAMVEAGLTRIDRALVMPHSVYQTVKERNPVSLRDFRKYVTNPQGGILVYN